MHTHWDLKHIGTSTNWVISIAVIFTMTMEANIVVWRDIESIINWIIGDWVELWGDVDDTTNMWNWATEAKDSVNINLWEFLKWKFSRGWNFCFGSNFNVPIPWKYQKIKFFSLVEVISGNFSIVTLKVIEVEVIWVGFLVDWHSKKKIWLEI